MIGQLKIDREESLTRGEKSLGRGTHSKGKRKQGIEHNKERGDCLELRGDI